MPARVLVIDDNLALATNLADILSGAKLGVEVVCKVDGAGGLADARANGFDVAIVDVKLPDTSGVALVRELHAASPFGEVVLITGAATVDAAIAALREGAFAFVLKSFRPEELVSTVEQALAKVALKRERRVLERRAADAEALSAMGSLTLGLAHEIRNPLNAAVLQLNLLSRAIGRLESEPERPKMLSHIAIIEGEMKRLERMLTEFLELARPRGIRRERVDIGKLVRDVLEFQQAVLSMRHIDLVSSIGQNCIATVDSEKIRQVVINLVVNALDAMPSAGTLTVKVSPVSPAGGEGSTPEPSSSVGGVRIEVGDTGAGINPKILPEIFDAFFTTKEAGTGLGLSIVRKVVDQHGGKVVVESAAGRGTNVAIDVPAE